MRLRLSRLYFALVKMKLPMNCQNEWRYNLLAQRLRFSVDTKTHCSTYWGTLFIRSVLEHEVLVLRNDVFGKEVVMSLNLAKTMRP